MQHHLTTRIAFALNIVDGQSAYTTDCASEMLIDIYGIEAARIKTVSYGEERPAVTGTGDSVWSKNRRDEFVPVYLKNN